ncbi:FUSC family protein [Paenibacillus swuensis]|uniref:FUSC family protein n=1 Tax=Paenibacillus swuensis TaxID=1178515 RepID=UPI0012FACD90|nr:aromatic acid exporter family protein [Paenibacillus swuensis]
MTLGARVFKTGVAVALALYASTLLGLNPPIIAAVAALFAMQPSIYRSWRYFLEQLQTNTIGATLALIAGYFFQNNPIAIGATCILVIVVCRQLKMEDSIGLTLVTVIAVMEAPGHWTFALNRFTLTIIGIVSSFLINILFLPPKPQGQFFATVQQVFIDLSLLLRTLISNEIKESVFQEEKDKLEGAIRSLDGKYKLFEEEEKKLKQRKYSDVRLLVVYKQMLNTLHKGYEILEAAEQHYFQASREIETDADFDQILEKVNKYHEHVLLKFDGKIKPDHADQYTMDADNEDFLRKIMDAYADRKDGRLRLAIVASAIYDYGFQVSRLEKLVDHHVRDKA